MSELDEKVKMSIQRLKAFEPDEGYSLGFSGGKDSVVIKALADMANVKYSAEYRLTSVDPPELVRFIKQEHSDVKIDIPRYKDGKQKTMWNLIVNKKTPPSRLGRYCCTELKETGGNGKLCITGVRWAESYNRRNNQGTITVMSNKAAKMFDEEGVSYEQTGKGGIVLNYDNGESQRMVTQCYRTMKTLVNPIIDWGDDDVWGFIKANGIHYCSLYDEGFKRIGCIGCPMAGKNRWAQFGRYPKYKDSYIRAFDKMLRERERQGIPWKNGCETGEEVFHWWMEDGVLPGQTSLFDTIDNGEDDNETW